MKFRRDYLSRGLKFKLGIHISVSNELLVTWGTTNKLNEVVLISPTRKLLQPSYQECAKDTSTTVFNNSPTQTVYRAIESAYLCNGIKQIFLPSPEIYVVEY